MLTSSLDKHDRTISNSEPLVVGFIVKPLTTDMLKSIQVLI